MKKLMVTTLFVLLNAGAYAQTPAEIVKSFYPKYSQLNQCYILDNGEGNTYCMKQIHQYTRDTAQGKLMYLAFAGNHFDFKENKENGGHVHAGAAGVFVLRQKAADDWQLLAALPDVSVGSFGSAPHKKYWTFHEFGKDKWGFLTAHGDVHQGFSGSHYVILAHDGGKKITQSWLGESVDNTGAYGHHCEVMDSVKERRKCLAKLQSIDSKIKILRNEKMVNGFYPLQITVSGFAGKTKYRQRAYVMVFDARKGAFEAPNHYPLKNIDY